MRSPTFIGSCSSLQVVVISALAVLPLLTLGQAPSAAKLRVEKAEMLIGESNTLIISAPAESIEPDLRYLDTIPGFWLSDQSAVEVVEVDGERQWRFPFSFYDSAGLLLPSIPVYLPGDTLYTNQAALHIDFPAADTSAVDFRPLREEPVHLLDFLFWILIAGVAVLILLVWWWLRRQKQRMQTVTPVRAVESPAEIALRELKELASQHEWIDERFYTKLDTILRSYLEGQYRIPALERTSREVLQLLRGQRLSAETLEPLLNQVDFVKFAKAELGPERRAQDLEAVRDFIRSSHAGTETMDPKVQTP